VYVVMYARLCLLNLLEVEDTSTPLLMITQDVVGCTLLGISQRCLRSSVSRV